ncbi:MAG TPA: tRNA preQ1(34) S-adenosylmethionine ribosyltransferase-isomerase QueA [Anaerolineae bacterium]|nr:tRNA preQ1(34) S-adenosylmethionine ribosyltransferase-isomerase QueA [Anaerolineae bacterium]HOQ97288.1 tRNA preQ1(34) S-adenosylmethionine ribosyltransferase-isomerase QueA [Anaerolineae bacterium]HOQ97381.1 tRNA preQ1(34) S-adenosylmethionine ribosyltransferase-isomerase QueA [Anaerolineae bacterium]HPL27342.1 tRNA preQ1(34) S-adenosylmethionine ribosyltransferase-isomerase QueA [Anaerolineae bacterium]
MKTAEFDYDLPPELIAQTPIEPRDAARLLVVQRAAGTLEHRRFRDVAAYLAAGDLLVLNESRVIPARLQARKVPSGGRVELLLLTRHDPYTWEALVGGRRARAGTRLCIEMPAGSKARPTETAGEDACPTMLEAEIIGETASGGRLIRFSAAVDDLLDTLGQVPLPPYIHTPLEDRERYQTVYARARGSVAAPTAGLHFTPQLLAALEAAGIAFATVTLHIGLDTFRPVSEERIEEHIIHREWCRIDEAAAEAIAATRARGGRVVAVGTTTVRVLETAAQAALASGSAGPVLPFDGWTDLYIYPGYRFRAVDALLTSFHLPRSTLLMLVSAFAGRELIRRAYEEAIRERYRFYSFGDAMLIV